MAFKQRFCFSLQLSAYRICYLVKIIALLFLKYMKHISIVFLSKMSILNDSFYFIYTDRTLITFITVNNFTPISFKYLNSIVHGNLHFRAKKKKKGHSAHIATDLFRWNKTGWHNSQAAGMVWQLIDRQWIGTLKRGAAVIYCILQLKLLKQKEVIFTSTSLILGYLSALS